MRRIHSFHDYIKEQENTGTSSGSGEKKEEIKGDAGLIGNLDAAGIASAMMSAAFKKLGFIDKDFSKIEETPETKAGRAYTSCGTAPYPFKPIEATNQEILGLFKDPSGKFAKDVRYADISKEVNGSSNKIFILGVRESLDIKQKEGDKFVDKIAIVDPSKPSERVVSYQATTTPSVEYYSDPKKTMNDRGVAIMQPGVYSYKIGIHRKGSPTEHEALVQDGEMDIQRFQLNSGKLETYQPGQPDKGDEYGINIHRSSQERGVCVGPYSAGCQVFADGTEFQNFMSVLKGSTANSGKFLYVLLENDDFGKTGDVESTSTEANDIAPAKEDRTEEFRSAGDSIRAELDKSNSDEESLISIYNQTVNSKKDAEEFKKFYSEEYNVDIIDDLDRALSNSELAQLKFK